MINIHIDNLVIHGFDRIERDQVGSAVQKELSRLISEQGLPSALKKSQTIGNLNAGEFRTGKSSSPRNVGIQVAQKIYRGMEL